MPWVLVLFLLPLVFFAVVVGRLIRVGRQLRDPEQLRSLLSDEIRAAILEEGLDPETVSVEEIQKSEKLKRLIAADLRRVLLSLVLGRRLPESGVSSGAARLPLGSHSGVPMHRWKPLASERAGQLVLPPPIDASSGPGIRAVVFLLLVAVLLIALQVRAAESIEIEVRGPDSARPVHTHTLG